MKRKTTRFFLCLMLIVLSLPGIVTAAPEQRIALVIGNSAYSSGPLKNPVNDATDMAAALQRLGFKVNLKQNANLEMMEEAIEDFGNRLKRGGVGLFYYAGHGMQVNGVNYLIPIGAKVNKESDVRYKAVDAGRILDEMANANNGMNIVLLDACRDNPFGKSFRSASRGLAIVSNSPSGTFISYSTSPGQVASDGDGRNSPYTAALLKYMQAPGLTISDLFINVRTKVKKETGQVPWELSSLEGQFYFLPGSAEKSGTAVTSGKATVEREESSVSTTAATNDLDDENRKLEVKQRRLEEERESFAKKTTILAMGKRPSVSTATEIKRDGRFIAYDNGTVMDTSTNLIWAAKDNGSEINWANAKSYCETYQRGGYSDWRMPTQDELAGLYDESKSQQAECSSSYQNHVATDFIHLTCFYPWASEARGSEAAGFRFYDGKRTGWGRQRGDFFRALPVRSAK